MEKNEKLIVPIQKAFFRLWLKNLYCPNNLNSDIIDEK